MRKTLDQVGMGPREAEELFELFDVDGSGGIDDKEFMKARYLCPLRVFLQ